jgi:membrane-anchored glycerophosphoryl diester phosphodiesterase (GDPDase)
LSIILEKKRKEKKRKEKKRKEKKRKEIAISNVLAPIIFNTARLLLE